MAIINIATGNFLPLYQPGDPPASNSHVAQNNLTISQIIRCSKQLINVYQLLSPTQAVAPAAVLSRAIISTLPIAQTMGRSKDLYATSVVYFTQTGASVNPQNTVSVLTITQDASPSRAVDGVLSISHEVIVQATFVRSLTSTNTVLGLISFFKTDGLNDYLITVPDIVPATAIVLTCGSESITLKIPEFKNGDKIELARVQAQCRGGDLILFSDPVWPKIETLTYTFKHMTKTMSDALLRFLELSLGLGVTLLDYEGVSWFGVITSPTAQTTCHSDNNCGDYDCELEFQGSKI